MTVTRSVSLLKASLVYFGSVFGAGFVLGAFRVPLLVPRLGVRLAELLEMPLMLIAIHFAAGWVVKRFNAAVQGKFWLWVGCAALFLMVTAELVLVKVLSGLSISEYVASRDPVSGAAYLVMLVVFALMPWVRCQYLQSKPSHSHGI